MFARHLPFIARYKSGFGARPAHPDPFVLGATVRSALEILLETGHLAQIWVTSN